MKKILLTITTILGLHATAAQAVSVGPYDIDPAANITDFTSASNIAATNGSSSLTDMSLSTYMTGDPVGSLGVSFSNSLYNGADDDLAFFFVRTVDDAETANFDLSIGESTFTYQASLYTYFNEATGTTDKYQALLSSGWADVLIATVDLGDFGIYGTDSINGLTISDLNNNERLSLAAGFHLTPVPVPASVWLFISGLGILSALRRRK